MEKKQRGRPSLPEDERIRRAEERKERYRLERIRKKKDENPNFKARTTYNAEGQVLHRNYVYKTVKTPDMSYHDYMTSIINEILDMPIPINSKENDEFLAYRKHRIETGIDESEDLFDKEIDKWPLPETF